MANDFKYEDAQVQPTEGFTFTEPQAITNYSAESLDTRTQKYSYAFGIDPEAAKASIESGQENNLLDVAASITAERNNQARLNAEKFAIDTGNVPLALDLKGTDKPVDSKSVLEEEFANSISSTIPYLLSAKSPYINDPGTLDIVLSNSAAVLTKKEISSTVNAKWDQIIKDTPLGKTVSDFAELLVPGLSMYRFREVARGLKERGVLSSTNIEALINEVYSLPTDKAIDRANQIAQELYDSNYHDAALFLKGLDSFSNSDRIWVNFNDALNLADPFVAGAITRGVRGITRAIGPTKISMTGIFNAAGDVQAAARTQATDHFIQLARATGNEQSVNAMLGTAPSFINPSIAITSTPNYSQRLANDLVRNLDANRDKLLGLVNEAVSVKRLEQNTPALNAAYTEAEAKIRSYARNVSNSIMDVRYINSDSNLANVAAVEARLGKIKADPEVMSKLRAANPDSTEAELQGLARTIQPSTEVMVGRPTAEFFDSVAEAENFGDLYGFAKNSYSVAQEAPGKFYISMIQHIDETSPTVYDALQTTLRNAGSNDLKDVLLRKLGSAEAVNDVSMSAGRNVGVHGTSKLLNDIAQHFESNIVRPLRKEEQARLHSFITYERDYENLPQNIIGKFSQDMMEFETEWKRLHGQLPTEAERSAYFNYVQISDYDWILRNLSDYTQMSSGGWEMIGLRGLSDVADIEGKLIKSLDNLGLQHEPIFSQFENGRAFQITRREAEELLENGYDAAQLHSAGMQKLPNYFPRNTEIVVSQELTRAPLSWERVAYRPGGHRVHLDDWFVSAEVMQGSTYMRDFNVGSHMIRSQAQQLVDNFNIARQMLRNADPVLDQFVTDRLATTPARFRALYDPATGSLDINTPFRLRRKDYSLADIYPLEQQYQGFRRHPGTLTESREQTQYLNSRSPRLQTVTYEGSPNNPTVRVQATRLLDPYATLARTLNSNLRNLYMDDIKLKHVQDFIARFGDLVEAPSADAVRLNPYRYAIDAPFKEGTPDLARLSAAKTYRDSIKNFLSIESAEPAMVKTFNERMLDTVFNRFGLTAAERVEPYLMHRITDPAKFLRAAAFHTKLGLFHIPSFLTQVMQYTNMVGVAGPTAAADALAWAQYARLMRKADPSVQKALAAKAGQWGGSAKDFEDYYSGLQRSGLLTVRGEVADLDVDKALQVSRSAGQTFLDWGRIPFDEGEKLSRIAAFQIAFREWRKRVGKDIEFSDDALREVMRRTDVLTGNMTRASLASWQKGIVSVPTQFFTWHLRMTEQMLGKTLTNTEKMRLVATNAVLFGLPAGLATAPLNNFIPWKSASDVFLNSYGISVDANQTSSNIYNAIINGGVAAFMKATLGDQFNVNERLGPGTLNPFYQQLFNDQKTAVDVILGAGGSTIKDIAKSTMPLIAHIASRVTGNDTGAGLDFSDFRDAVVNNISSLSSAERLLWAINTGKYISKNEKNIADLPEWKAWINFMTGFQPREVKQASEKQDYINAIKGLQKLFEPIMTRKHRAMYDAIKNGDFTAADQYEKQLKAMYEGTGMNQQERTSFELKALRKFEKSWASQVDEQLRRRNSTQAHRVFGEQMEKTNGQ